MRRRETLQTLWLLDANPVACETEPARTLGQAR